MEVVRQELKSAAAVRKQNYTIREAIEWYKNVYRIRFLSGSLLETETEHINSQFVELISRTSKKDQLPKAALASLVASVAVGELAEELASDVKI